MNKPPPKRRPEIEEAIVSAFMMGCGGVTGKQLEKMLPYRHGYVYEAIAALLADGKLEKVGGFYVLNVDHYLPIPKDSDTEPELPSEDVDLSELEDQPLLREEPVDRYELRLIDHNGYPTWILFIPDVHRPHHSKDAWRLMIKVAKNMRARCRGKFIIVILGDYLDAYSVSRHTKNPNLMTQLEVEIADGNEGLDELDAIGADEKYYVMGNHEFRLIRYLAEKAPELYNMVTVESLLKLEERGWKVTKYQDTLAIGKFHITHDLGKAGSTAHEDARDAYEGCAVIGHTHRSSVSYRANLKGEAHVGAMFGWLGDPRLIDYKHQAKALRDWIHGVGVGIMEPDGVVHLHAVPFILNRACIFSEIVT